ALNGARNQLIPKSRLINQIYGVGAEINDATVEVLISRLRKKLSPYGVTIKIARGIGYYLQEAE
ncbi:MAG: helix-turn-helix domain-containing protein, partial [Alphaproteobacteria bacterium]|nr:helix-turn-helix domain-containing protein [Alphaproteobacteria bacterium]